MTTPSLRPVAQVDLEAGDTMGATVCNGYLYLGHSGRTDIATTVVDVRDPRSPRVVRQLLRDPGTRSAKAIAVDGILLTSCERELDWGEPPFVRPVGGAEAWTGGLRIWDLAAPEDPQPIGFYPAGGAGVHRMTWLGGRYAYVTAGDAGYTDQFLHVVDLSDPSQPQEAGRWWYPGMWVGGGERPRFPGGRRYALHHALPGGDLLACGWWDAGLVLLDAADPRAPQFVANLNWGPEVSGATHTALPLPERDLLVVVDEAILPPGRDIDKQVRLLDISEPHHPRLVSAFPTPTAEDDGVAVVDPRARFGPHNLGEPRPGTPFDDRYVFLTCFAGGLRVYDLEDPEKPVEVAALVPDLGPDRVPQSDDVTADDRGFVYLTDRTGGGLTVLEWG